MKGFKDTNNFLSVPDITNYIEYEDLINNLTEKAEILSSTDKDIEAYIYLREQKHQKLAIKHYEAADFLLSKIRKNISTKSDKLALGSIAGKVYKEALNVCMKKINKFKKHAFNFSERNKASVLLEALAGSEALKFAGVPDSLLEQERTFSIDITSYKNLKNEAKNDSLSKVYSEKLFVLNRKYERLIQRFEANFPDYYKLKYNKLTVSIKDIKKTLNKNTALISYFVLDSTIVIFAITKKGLEVYNTEKIPDFDNKIENFRTGIQSPKKIQFEQYKESAHEFFSILFPKKCFQTDPL